MSAIRQPAKDPRIIERMRRVLELRVLWEDVRREVRELLTHAEDVEREPGKAPTRRER